MRNNLKPLYIAILACLSGHAYAEHLTLPDVEVKEKRIQESLTQPDIQSAKKEIEKTAGGVTIVDLEQVREGRVSNFNDTLGLASGVFAQSRFGAEETRLSIRGSGLQRTFHGRGIKLMQDGIPVNLADGSFDFPSIDPLATRHIEVYRGANALQYGATNLGGAINFISNTGYNAPKLEIRTEGGTYGYHRLGISTGAVIDQLDYFVTASTYHQSSFRDNAQQSADRLTGNIGYRINDNIETRFYFGHINNDSQLPSNLSKTQLKDDPKQSTVIPGQGINQRDVNLTRIANKTTFLFDNTKLELGVFYSRKSLFHPIIGLFGMTGGFVDSVDVISQESDDYGLTARLNHHGKLFGLDNEFIVGLSPTYGETDARNYQNINARRGQLINRFDQTATNIETFVENRLNITSEVTLIAGLQHTRAERKSDDKLIRAQTGDQSVDETFNQTSPKIGVLYQYEPNVQFFANVSRSYEPPSFGELNNAVANFLKAQKGTTFEIGSRGNSEHIDWDVAVYYAKIQDELLQVSTIPGFFGTTVNADKTIHSGLEFGMTARLPANLEWRQNLLINNFKLDDDAAFGNNRLPGIPRSLLRGELLYRNSGFYIGPTIEVSPQRYAVDFAETLYADSYTLLGLKMGQQYNDHWSWFLEGRNLTDKKYAASTGITRTATPNQDIFLPGEGRTVYMGLQWRY
jgi:iron complex outermembrane receptor protein